MSQPYKVLILSSSFGQGHMATARALQAAAAANPNLSIEVEIIDFSKEVNQLFDQTSKKIYEFNTKHMPAVYKWLYVSSDYAHTPIRIANLLNYPIRRNHLKKLLQQSKPDLIISNYPIWQYLAYQISKKLFPDVEFATLITDSISVHSSWTIPDSDFYLVANSPTADSLHALGVSRKKIFPLGYPVHQAFTTPDYNAAQVKQDIRIPVDRTMIVFSASALRTSYVRRVVSSIANHFQASTIVTITGRDDELYEAIRDDEIWSLPHALLLSWTDNMAGLIRASDIVITKAGGSTVMECVTAIKPLIINKIIPGQEEGNAELVSQYGLGKIARKSSEIVSAIREITADYPNYIKRLTEQSRPTAATDILTFVQQRLAKTTKISQ